MDRRPPDEIPSAVSKGEDDLRRTTLQGKSDSIAGTIVCFRPPDSPARDDLGNTALIDAAPGGRSDRPCLFYGEPSRPLTGDLRSTAARARLTRVRAARARRGEVIDPVAGDLNASMAKMKAMPEICPITRSRLFDVPSGAGCVISAAYWKPTGPALRRKKPCRPGRW